MSRKATSTAVDEVKTALDTSPSRNEVLKLPAIEK
jgi:hypothetical protein